MGWKKINGHSYYYRSVREGDRVRSEYVGQGEMAALIARANEFERNHRESMRKAAELERKDEDQEERAIAEWFDGVQAVADEAMRAAGFHKHKGQWRRKRK